MSHDAELVTDHVHSRPAVTVKRPVPPAAATDEVELPTVTAHLSRDGPVMVVDDVPHPAARNATAKLKLKKMRFTISRLPFEVTTLLPALGAYGRSGPGAVMKHACNARTARSTSVSCTIHVMRNDDVDMPCWLMRASFNAVIPALTFA